MAISTSSSALVLLYLTTASSLFLLSNGATPVVDNVCRQTRDQSLCANYLTSDPRTPTASLVQLADVAVQLAGYRANSVKMEIHEALLRTPNPARGPFGTCENFYLDAFDLLFRVAPGQVQSRQFGALSQLGARVAGQVDGCEAAFGNNSPFKLQNRVVAVLAEAIKVIGSSL